MSAGHPIVSGLPDPTFLSVIAAIALVELETEHPGFLDRIIARLSSDALRAQIVSIRGARARPSIIEAQETALLWLAALRPLARPPEPMKRKRRR